MTSLLLAALLTLTPDGSAPSPQGAPAAAAEAPPPAKESWYDEGHSFVSEGLIWSVTRLDHFFSDERAVDLPRSRTFIRWRNDLKITDTGKLSFTTGARAEVHIAPLDQRLERLRLTISGGTTETLDRLLPGDTRTPDAVDRPAAGLKLALLDALLTQSDVQAGLLFSLPLGWYTRLVLRHVRPVEGVGVARMAASVFWQTPTGWGTRQDLDLERQLAPWLLLRLDNTGTITERSRGWEWSSELALLAAVGDRTALFLGAGPSGATRRGPYPETWRVHARVRRDVLRRWLYLEVEPGVTWTRPERHWRVPPHGVERERSVILRLEVQFDAAAQRPPAPAPGPPAP